MVNDPNLLHTKEMPKQGAVKTISAFKQTSDYQPFSPMSGPEGAAPFNTTAKDFDVRK